MGYGMPPGQGPPPGYMGAPAGQPPATQAAPAQQAAGAAPAAAKGVWSEHVDKTSGKTYYYNSVTKASVWTKPQELMTQADTKAVSSDWKEYTAPDGRKYYNNAKTGVTQWTKPEDFEAPAAAAVLAAAAAAEAVAPAAAAAASAVAPAAASAVVPDEATNGKRSADERSEQEREEEEEQRRLTKKERKAKEEAAKDLPAPKYDTKEEAIAAFRELLEEKITTHKVQWADAIPTLQLDVRFKAVKSLGEKKNIYQAFVAKKARDFVDSERIRKKAAKEGFQELLHESDFIDHKTRYRDVVDMLEKDPRYAALDNERERGDMFEDYVMGNSQPAAERCPCALKFCVRCGPGPRARTLWIGLRAYRACAWVSA
jgi:pre-mRNA-processing factor 40